MTTLNQVLETLATLTEAFAWMAVSLHFSGTLKKDDKFWLKIILSGVLDALLVWLLNQIELFSFATPVLTMVLMIVCSFAWNRKGIVVCAASAVITVTTMVSIDYILFFLFGVISENPIIDARTFMTLMSPVLPRYLYLITAKAAQILLAICVVRRLPSLKKLRKQYTILLLLVSGAFYVMMSYLVSMILSASILVLQTAVILSLIFILACIIVLLAVCFIFTDYRAERERNQLLSTVNALTEENYQKLSALQKELSKQNHDFVKHIQTIHGLIHANDSEEAFKYTEMLLKAPVERAALCKSGNSVIDAVINSKIAEAAQKQIMFHFQVNFFIPTNIASIDICTILGNQLDNAIEACQIIADSKDRQINVHIYQQAGSAAVFQVSNTVAENPFLCNADLHTTKDNSDRLHGLGLQNIRETAEKYQGILENNYQNGRFISSALLYFTPQVSAENKIPEEKD